MSYQSFYQDSFGVATDGYAENYSNYESTSTTEFGMEGSKAFLGNNASFEADDYNSNNFEQQLSLVTTNSSGLYNDPNPQIIRRPASEDAKIYMQRIFLKFLQPPPVPPPGPLIIKEIRPPQPPPPPPLYIRQRPPLPPTLPPIVIREAPPKVPAAVGTQIITKMLPALPVPPRSVIIERLPPLPPKPRDVIVERWLPYRSQQKRRVIIQRAPPPVLQKPRNIIIYYEAPKTQIVRRFQNLGVQLVNPTDYIARYGTQLEDAQTLITHARQAGVVEDISPPVSTGSNFQSSTYENYQSDSTDLGEISTNNYELSSVFDSSSNNSNDFLAGNPTSYESYSSEQTFS